MGCSRSALTHNLLTIRCETVRNSAVVYETAFIPMARVLNGLLRHEFRGPLRNRLRFRHGGHPCRLTCMIKMCVVEANHEALACALSVKIRTKTWRRDKSSRLFGGTCGNWPPIYCASSVAQGNRICLPNSHINWPHLLPRMRTNSVGRRPQRILSTPWISVSARTS